MEDKKIEASLKRASEAMTPAYDEKLWETPVKQASETDWFLAGTAKTPVKRKPPLPYFAAAAACILVCVLSVFMTNYRVDASVFMDVNPSVMLETNQQGKVLSAEAENADGEAILDGMELKGTKIDVAVNALLGSMVKQGYLSPEQNTILLSVNGRNEQRTEALKNELADEIDLSLHSLLGKGTVLSHVFSEDEETERIAAVFGISHGKAALIQKLCKADPSLDQGTLASLSMNALLEELHGTSLSAEQFVDTEEAPVQTPPAKPPVVSESVDTDDDDDLYDDDDDDDTEDDDDDDDDDDDED